MKGDGGKRERGKGVKKGVEGAWDEEGRESWKNKLKNGGNKSARGVGKLGEED